MSIKNKLWNDYRLFQSLFTRKELFHPKVISVFVFSYLFVFAATVIVYISQ